MGVENMAVRRAYRYMRIPLALGLIIALLSSTLVLPVFGQGYEPPHANPGPAVDRVYFKAFHQDIAAASLEQGDMDLYIYGLKTLIAEQLVGIPDVKMYQAPATSFSLILNPALTGEGELNPFSIKEIRYALNYIIDREHIAQEIYKGMAKLMLAHVSPFDFDYRIVHPLLQEFKISYQPELAKQIITDEMTKAGAELVDDYWHYQGKRIDLKFIIRIEDERRQVGDLITAELKALGFSIIPIYQQFGPALSRVYGNDPQLFEWHLYTEGWGKGAPERYDYALINQMYAPWLGNMPGFQELGFWQYKNAEIDELGKSIFTGDFKTVDERNELYRQMTKLGMEEAVRLWVATAINNFPATAELEGVTEDIASGPRGQLTLREAHIPGENELTIGSQYISTQRSIWNPVGGFGDIYSNDIWGNIFDPLIMSHPFTGVPIPFRVQYEVTSAGPSGQLDVPADAFLWDAETGKYASVAAGEKAISKVTLDFSDYFSSNWHHGQPITMADVLYSIYQSYDMVYNEDKANIEFTIATTNKPVLDTFRGFRVLDDNTLEVYLDFWHFVPDYIASYALPTSLSTPWEILAAMDEIVFTKRRAAYTDTAAARYSVSWLSLVMDGDARLVRKTLLEFIDDSYLPLEPLTLNGEPLISEEEAQARYQAAIDWFDEHGLMVISNGPFKLVRFDAAAQFAELEAFRDPSYPFKPGQWPEGWFFGSSPAIEIKSVDTSAISPGEDATINVEISGPGELSADYLLLDPAQGMILKTGEAEKTSPTSFAIQLSSQDTSAMQTGIYYLYTLAYSDSISSLAERRTDIDLQASPILGPDGTQPTTPGSSEEGGISPILIILPIAVVVAGVVVFFILRGGQAKKTS
jgi:peptide/nickel transport system substrate-binding protein|tara:strand:- start:6283 stop:8883 length:2601 start_codon:yes stop_codon:yes gene_type:complete